MGDNPYSQSGLYENSDVLNTSCGASSAPGFRPGPFLPESVYTRKVLGLLVFQLLLTTIIVTNLTIPNYGLLLEFENLLKEQWMDWVILGVCVLTFFHFLVIFAISPPPDFLHSDRFSSLIYILIVDLGTGALLAVIISYTEWYIILWVHWMLLIVTTLQYLFRSQSKFTGFIASLFVLISGVNLACILCLWHCEWNFDDLHYILRDGGITFILSLAMLLIIFLRKDEGCLLQHWAHSDSPSDYLRAALQIYLVMMLNVILPLAFAIVGCCTWDGSLRRNTREERTEFAVIVILA